MEQRIVTNKIYCFTADEWEVLKERLHETITETFKGYDIDKAIDSGDHVFLTHENWRELRYDCYFEVINTLGNFTTDDNNAEG